MRERGRPVGSDVPPRPVAENRTVQQLDHSIRNEAAAVVAVIDDQSVFGHLRIEALEKLPIPLGAGVGKVDISDPASRFLTHVFAARLNPLEVTKVPFLLHRPYCFRARAAEVRAGVDQQGYVPIGLVLEQTVEIFHSPRRDAVDGEDEVALSDAYSRLGQRRAEVLMPVLARENVRDPVVAAGIGHDLGSEQAAILARDRPVIGCADVNVTGVELAAQFAEDEVEIRTVGEVRDEGAVLHLHRVPVDAVHVRVVEEVSKNAPAVVELLCPFRPRLDLHLEVVESDETLGSLLTRLYSCNSVCRTFAEKNLLFIRRDGVTLNSLEDCFLFLVVDVVEPERGCGAAAGEIENAVLHPGESTVVPRGSGNCPHALLEAGDIDSRDRACFRRLRRGSRGRRRRRGFLSLRLLLIARREKQRGPVLGEQPDIDARWSRVDVVELEAGESQIVIAV